MSTCFMIKQKNKIIYIRFKQIQEILFLFVIKIVLFFIVLYYLSSFINRQCILLTITFLFKNTQVLINTYHAPG